MRLLAGLFVCLGLLISSTGCDSAPPKPTAGKESKSGHDHEHVEPKSFAEGIAALQKQADLIAAAFVKDAPEAAHEAAHDALHDVGHTLEALEGFGKGLQVGDDEKGKVMEALKTLFDNYGKIDDAMHHNTEVKYDEMKDAIKQALDVLSAVKS